MSAQRITMSTTTWLVIAMMGIAILGLITQQTGGLSALRFKDSAATIENLTALYQQESAKWNDPETTAQCFQLPEPFVVPKPDFFVQQGCLKRRAGKPAVLLMGDSHSASLGVGLRQWAKTQDMDYLQASGFLDPRLFCINQKTRKDLRACTEDYARAVMKTLAAAKPDVLVLDMYWSHPETLSGYANMDAWIQQIQRAVGDISKELGVKKVIIVGQVPTWNGNLPQLLLKEFAKKKRSIPQRTFVTIDETSLKMEAALKKASWPKNTQYFSIQELLCTADGCLTRVGDNERTDLIVWDYGHLTESGSRHIAENGLGERILKALPK